MSKLRQFYKNSDGVSQNTTMSIEQAALVISEITNQQMNEADNQSRSLVSIESLEALSDLLADAGNLDEASVKAIEVAVESILATESLSLESIGLESFSEEGDVSVSAERLKDKLETFKEFFSGGFDKNVKKRNRELADAVAAVTRVSRDSLETVRKYKDRIEETNIKILEIDIFGQIYQRAGNVVQNPITELKSDTATIREYVELIGKEGVRYFKEIDKALDIKVVTDADADKLLTTLSKIKNPFSTIRPTFGHAALLNNTGIERDEEKPIKFNRNMGSIAERVVFRTYLNIEEISGVDQLLATISPKIFFVKRGIEQSGFIRAKSLGDMATALVELSALAGPLVEGTSTLTELYDSIKEKLNKLIKDLPKGINSDDKKDIKRLSFLTGHLKAVIRHPASGIFKHVAELVKRFDGLQRRLVGKIENRK